ncbi:MAG: hypothetical protein AB7G11_14025 [Phycisphaerales bacterium]
MIWESHPWKVDLARRAAWLRKQQHTRKWPESALVCGFNRREGLSFVLFCSDRQRNKNLFQASVRTLASMFDAVARDGVWSSRLSWNAERKDYDVKNR